MKDLTSQEGKGKERSPGLMFIQINIEKIIGEVSHTPGYLSRVNISKIVIEEKFMVLQVQVGNKNILLLNVYLMCDL